MQNCSLLFVDCFLIRTVALVAKDTALKLDTCGRLGSMRTTVALVAEGHSL